MNATKAKGATVRQSPIPGTLRQFEALTRFVAYVEKSRPARRWEAELVDAWARNVLDVYSAPLQDAATDRMETLELPRVRVLWRNFRVDGDGGWLTTRVVLPAGAGARAAEGAPLSTARALSRCDGNSRVRRHSHAGKLRP
jgi:hypothetical protein